MLPALAIYSIVKDWNSWKPSLLPLAIKTFACIFAYKWFIIFVIDHAPHPIKDLLLMFTVIPLMPEVLFVKYFMPIRLGDDHEWLRVCLALSFAVSVLAGAVMAGAKHYVLRQRQTTKTVN
ncbi:MAG: hypothetical protein M0D55_18865 [Elusimicrobiota bacterium]|nr:MAG: hypothetical protein M0D55_18865 [Elusimicrobiota bacterium]